MDGLAEDIIQMRFSTEDQGEAVQGIIAVVHQHLQIIQDTVVEILSLIDCQQKRLMFVSVQVGDLFLDRFEHGWFATFIGYTQNGTKLFVEVSDTYGRQAHVLHMELVGVQAFGKASQGIGLSHSREGGEDTDTADVFQMIETFVHFLEVSGTETVFFLQLLFVKRIKSKAVKRVIDHSVILQS